MTDTLLTDQVRQALALFLPAHKQAEVAAAAVVDKKRLVGSNEAERKERKAQTSPEEYAALCEQLADLERTKAAAAAHLERCEKEINVLREMLNHSTAELERVTSARNADTADVYARISAPIVLVPAVRARYPAAGTTGNCADCGQPLTLDIHDACIPF